MKTDPLQYDKWIEEALRGVIRRALAKTAAEGLPGEHHFYIAFNTGAAGVAMPEFLKAQHPGEMTIVLQNQFEDLIVGDDSFTVTLKFGGKPQRLQIPLKAVVSFTDPSVNFGLHLKPGKTAGGGAGVQREGEADSGAAGGEDGEEEEKMGEVIALDTFRKK